MFRYLVAAKAMSALREAAATRKAASRSSPRHTTIDQNGRPTAAIGDRRSAIPAAMGVQRAPIATPTAECETPQPCVCRQLPIGRTMARTRGGVMSRQGCLLRLLLGSAVLVAGLAHPPHARAETIVTGVPDELTLEAHDASIQDVLEALGTKFGLRYRNIAAIDRRFDGTYEGSLRRVMTR